MSFRKLLASVLVALSVLFMVQPAEAASSGATITFNIRDASGNLVGQHVLPAEWALGSDLAQYFQSVADAVREMLVKGGNPTKSVWISAKVLIQLVGDGLEGTGGSGGGVSSP